MEDKDITEDISRVKPWLIPTHSRPKLYVPHPSMSAEEIRHHTQQVWDSFYSMPKIWRRSRCVRKIRARLAFLFISKLYRQMYANTGIAANSSSHAGAVKWARIIAKPCRALFAAKPRPDLPIPAPE